MQRRFLAEDLVRLRRSDEARRSVAPQRAARVDPNPHQVEAVIFALSRIPEGGCILADEVGLGKTIEAGLVMTQLLAEGARRILLLAPKALLGQWKQELEQLFGLAAREGRTTRGGFDGEGVFLINREAAGGEKGARALREAAPFDLCVIDEAHEVFSGVFRRFTADGSYDPESELAQTAGRIRDVLREAGTPVLLLTATPIQNNLKELWGLVQYVDPLGTLLGDLPTFKEVFCRAEDREVAHGQEPELRRRLKQVLQRTLRRQAQEFLEKKFVERHARLFSYAMSPAERSLYDDVTSYLLEPALVAFRGRHRALLLLGFHRRMASSTRALAVSLERVVARLERMLSGAEVDDEADLAAVVGDLDEAELEPGPDGAQGSDAVPPISAPAIAAELARVQGFVDRARALGDDDGKFRALMQALASVKQRAEAGQGAAKVVVFTESLVTQAYLEERLVATGLVRVDEVTLFRGVNDGPRARAALERWLAGLPAGTTPPSPDVAVRLALVDEFRTRTRVFISTEAGAKGLNLQFCNVVVNYDLPWNPQRIEQRIGRCHRYGQQHDVTVINFINKDNEAEQLTFELLSRKLELFGTVLSASDQVLHHADAARGQELVSAVGGELEAELNRIYERARTRDELTRGLKALVERTSEERQRFEEARARTESIIEERFDDEVKKVFRLRRDELPRALSELDADLWTLVTDHLAASGTPFRVEPHGPGRLLEVGPSGAPGPLAAGFTVASGPSERHPSLHLGHPLVVSAIAAARAGPTVSAARVPARVAPGWRTGRLQLVKVTFPGFERTQRLAAAAVSSDGQALDLAAGLALLRAPMTPATPVAPPVPDEDMADAVDSVVFELRREVEAQERALFQRAAVQADRYLDDRVLVWKRRLAEAEGRLEAASRKRDGTQLPSTREHAEAQMAEASRQVERAGAALERLYRRDDETFRKSTEHIRSRRAGTPTVELLADVHLVCEGA